MFYRSAKLWLASALVLPAFAQAGDLSYSYVEAMYGETEIDVGAGVGSVDGDGFGIAGSLAIAPNWHLFADYTTADFDFNVDTTTYRIGGGLNRSISDKVDFVARLAYVNMEVEVDTGFGTFSEDDGGLGLGVGLRGQMTEAFELGGAVEYVDIGSDGDTSFSAEGRYFFTQMFAVGAGIEVGDDTTTYGIMARLNFN